MLQASGVRTLACLLLAGCAGAASAGDALAVAGKPERKVLVDDTVTDAQLKQIFAKGYRPENQARGHEVYYCRRETDAGSRIQTRVCRTAARILQDEQQGKEALVHVQQNAQRF